MFSLGSHIRYYLCLYDISMGSGIQGLCRVINNTPFSASSGDAFVFLSRDRTEMKILRWDTSGFLLYQKSLAKGTFELPEKCDAEGCYEIPYETFFMIIRGINLVKTTRRDWFSKV